MLMDSSSAENPLLQDVEFDDEQILMAVRRPLQEFAEASPPGLTQYDSQNFPWRDAWLDGIVGYLLTMAAHRYRRNTQQIVTGNANLNELNREREYLQAAELYFGRWRAFITLKRTQASASGFFGTLI
jgi:hypothetical protein